MIDDVTDEHRHTRNHGIEEDELCQMAIDGTSVETVQSIGSTFLCNNYTLDKKMVIMTINIQQLEIIDFYPLI